MRIRNTVRSAALAGVLAAGGAGIAACTTAVPALSQCAMTTNGGFGSSGQGITSVTHPGGKVSVGSGETAWYYPCNDRNYVTAKSGGDRDNPLAVRTGAQGGTPGMPVYVWSSVYFTANQEDAVMKKFLPFCLKYGCAGTGAQSDDSVSGSAHSSTPGWNNMLAENMAPAVDRASETAVAQFGPDLWRTQDDWNKLATMIAANLNAQLAVETGSSVPFFCGDASTGANCLPMTVVVSNVTPEDPAVITAYNQEVQAEQSSAANAARLAQATLLYGSLAHYALMIQDEANMCGAKCTLYIGAPGSLPTAAAGR